MTTIKSPIMSSTRIIKDSWEDEEIIIIPASMNTSVKEDSWDFGNEEMLSSHEQETPVFIDEVINDTTAQVVIAKKQVISATSVYKEEKITEKPKQSRYFYIKKVVKKNPLVEIYKEKRNEDNKKKQMEAANLMKEQITVQYEKMKEKNISKHGIDRPSKYINRVESVKVVDSSVIDSSVIDSSVIDSSVIDSSVIDSSVIDSSVIDSSVIKDVEEELNENEIKETMNAWICNHITDDDLVEDVEPKNVESKNVEPKPKKHNTMSLETYTTLYRNRSELFINLDTQKFPSRPEKIVKSRVCKSVVSRTKCKNGVACRYAHNIDELFPCLCSYDRNCRLVKTSNGRLINRDISRTCNFIHTAESIESCRSRIKKQFEIVSTPTEVIHTKSSIFTPAPILPIKKTGWLNTVLNKKLEDIIVVPAPSPDQLKEMSFRIPIAALSVIISIIRKKGYRNVKIELY